MTLFLLFIPHLFHFIPFSSRSYMTSYNIIYLHFNQKPTPRTLYNTLAYININANYIPMFHFIHDAVCFILWVYNQTFCTESRVIGYIYGFFFSVSYFYFEIYISPLWLWNNHQVQWRGVKMCNARIIKSNIYNKKIWIFFCNYCLLNYFVIK